MANTPIPARWYMLSKDGMATLCVDKADAKKEAKKADAIYPNNAPHSAVLMSEALPSTPARGEAPKDHQIAALVNELRDIALQYHNTQQLRERIAHAVVPALRAAQAATAQRAGITAGPLNKRQLAELYFEALGQERPALFDHICVERFTRLVERHHGIAGGSHE